MGEVESDVSPSKKRKSKVEPEDAEVSPEKKPKTFCSRTFRQELKGSEPLKSIKRFIQAAKNSEEVIFEYLRCGGSLQEILSLIDLTATGDLTTALPVFEVVHLIFLRFQSLDSKHCQKCIEGARTILRSHIPIVKAMLSVNVTKQKKVALKLMTAIATLDSTFANEIINVVALSPGLIADLVKPTPDKESVRKCFILFLLSFLIEGNPIVLKNLLEKKGFLGSIIPGLKFDEADTVNLTLSLFEDKILKNVKITKTLKLKLFNTQIIKALFDLFDWKGLQSIKQLAVPKKKNKMKMSEVDPKEKEIVIDSVHSFLILLCCSKKYGVAFADKSFGTSNQLSNELLLTVLESLTDPLKNDKMADVVLKTLSGCPDLVTPILHKFEPSFQPRSSQKWFEAIEFSEKLIKEVDAAALVKNEGEIPSVKRVVKIGQTLCAPVVFLRVIKSASENSQPLDIQLRSLKLLSTLWKEMEKLFASQNFGSELKKHLRHHFSKFVPDADDLIQLWRTLCKTKDLFFSYFTDTKTSLLSVVLDALKITFECQGETINLFSLTSELLRHFEEIRETIPTEEFDDIQVKIIRFMESDLESLMSNFELFEKLLLILLQSPDDSSLSFLSKILSSLDFFQTNKQEIDVWILCYKSLSKEQRGLVASYLVESLHRCFDARNEMTKLLMSCGTKSGTLTGENDRYDAELSLTNLIFACVEVFKSHLEDSNDKTKAFRHFLNDVVIHLQHFYSVDLYLHDRLKGIKKVISKPILNYLENWKENLIEPVNSEIFSCSLELSLVTWFVNDKDTRKFEKIIDTKSVNLLKLQAIFRTVVAFLSIKIKNESWSDNDVNKFSEALKVLLKTDVVESERDNELISYDFDNLSVYQRQCLNVLFLNNNLLNEFDVLRKKESTTTAIVFRVLMENEIFKNLLVKKKLTEQWKCKFLKQLMNKLKKKKSLKGCKNLEKVLNFFDYEVPDIAEVIDLFLRTSDLNLFTDGDSPSMWTIILMKMCALHCQELELSEEYLKKLCLIMQELCEKGVKNLHEFDNSFVFLLRSHPQHLLYIDNDFLHATLQRTNTTLATHTLGKLLLNDPNKVEYFLKLLMDDEEAVQDSKLLFSLLSALIIHKEEFLSNLKETQTFSKSLENPESPVYKALGVVFKKYQKNILKAIAGEGEELILKNLNLTREIVKLFIGKKQMNKITKEIQDGKFEPVLMYEAIQKLNDSTLRENYMKGLLTMFCRLIKNYTNGEDWSKYCTIVSNLAEENSSWENIVISPVWKEFTKLALGYCFTSESNAPLLKCLRLLVETFYPTESKDCELFFQMAISHSQFLKIILSNGGLKNELVELFYCLIKRCRSEMSPKHVPILLASYTASLSPCDVTLLKILRLYEKSDVKLGEYEPFVWGETAVSHYSIGTGRGLSLWQRFNMGNVLDLIDGQRMEASLKEFPIRRNLEINKTQNDEYDSVVYDPAFILPLFVNLLSPGSVAFFLSFIYKGGLAYTVRALSSESKDIRAIAALVLSRFYNHLELSQNLKQKLVWMHFINCFRYGIENLSAQPLPNIATLFFARMTLELSRHPAEMYVPLQNFLLAKSYFTFDTVPEFLALFHSSEVAYWKHRTWLLEVMRDGTKAASDINCIFHTMAVKVFFSFFHSQLCDNESKKLILQVVEKMLRIDKSILLISEYGLLNWITSIDADSYQPILKDLLILLSTTLKVIVKDIKDNDSNHSNSSHLVQILNMSVKLLPSLKALKSVEIFQIYLKLVLNCLVFFIEGGQTHWFKINKNRLIDLIEAGSFILGEGSDCGKFCKLPFYFREFQDCAAEVYEDLKNSVFMFSTLVNGTDKTKSHK